MTKSGASKSVTLKRTTIAASKGMALERSSTLSAPDGAARAEVEIGSRAHAMWAAQGWPDGLELQNWLRVRSEHPKNS